ncbi:MAG: hypothetical protein KJO11_04845 [Gemmatimonadetes bacterium]|nr:hypothetical protein [Gemmatimonadota bacterium]MBT8402801.1 hypothetical protein [Gemmatimonadota bacterium]NNK61718.1 hypothetical protein [Gemmatimonadota bacterium]
MANLPERPAPADPLVLKRFELEGERDEWVRKRRLHQIGVAAADAWLWWSFTQGGGGLILGMALVLLFGLFGLEWLRWTGARNYDRRIEALGGSSPTGLPAGE